MKPSYTQDDTAGDDHPSYRYLLWLLPVTIIVFDQIVKEVMVAWLGPQADSHRWELVGDLIAFQYLENTGAAFGMLPDQTGLLAAISIVIIVACGFLIWRDFKHHPLGALAIAMVAGGAIGNMIDRIRLGYVVDYVAVGGFPKFNIADSAITIGIVLLLWSVVRDERAARKDQREHG